MTGIERLRELADKYAELGKDHTTIDVVPSGMAMLFSSIANQIGREHAEDCYGMVIDHGIVSRVASDMERHVLGHEGMEDSPVARWARELRASLGGREEEVTDVATIRKDAYDAYEWVEAHGGLDAVKRRWECLSYYADPVPRACMERRLASRQRQIDESHAALRRRNEMLKRYEEANEELLERAAAMKRRLMPEGMEWPRYESGKPVMLGDSVIKYVGGGEFDVRSIEFGEGVTYLREGFRTDDIVIVRPGDRVMRPAPKVLDADGAEIRVGDKLYDIKTGFGRTVRAINANKTIEFDGYVDRGWLAKFFTHRAPVLAADGRPLREGETVYKLDDDRPYTLKRFDGEHVYINAGGSSFDIWTFSNKLTHERPESWERLEEDVAGASCPDVYCANHHIDASDTSYEWAMARDIVRRAKALAERGA